MTDHGELLPSPTGPQFERWLKTEETAMKVKLCRLISLAIFISLSSATVRASAHELQGFESHEDENSVGLKVYIRRDVSADF